MTGRTHYDTLDVPPDATAAEIREAFARRIETQQLDVGGQSLEADREALAAAYEVLADPERRAGYDWRLGIDDLQPLDWGGAKPEPHGVELAPVDPSRGRRFGWLRALSLLPRGGARRG
jgi:DnaJ-class molecular chaperone